MICHVCAKYYPGCMAKCIVCGNTVCRGCGDWNGRCHDCTDNAIAAMQHEYDQLEARLQEEKRHG